MTVLRDDLPTGNSDVISGVSLEPAGTDVRVKFGDSRSNGSRDIRGADCVSNEHTNAHDRGLKMGVNWP